MDGDAAEEARLVHPGILICDMDRGNGRRGYMNHALQTGANFIQFRDYRGLPSEEDIARMRGAAILVNYCCVEDPTRLFGLFALGVNFPLVDDVAGAMRAARGVGIKPLEPIYDAP